MVCFPLPLETDGADAISPWSPKALQLISPCQRRLPMSCLLQRYVLSIFRDSGVLCYPLGGIHQTHGSSWPSTSCCIPSKCCQLRRHGSAWRHLYTRPSLITLQRLPPNNTKNSDSFEVITCLILPNIIYRCAVLLQIQSLNQSRFLKH